MTAEVRLRLSRGSGDVQTGQSQPMIGTPFEVPVPRKVKRTIVIVSSWCIDGTADYRRVCQRVAGKIPWPVGVGCGASGLIEARPSRLVKLVPTSYVRTSLCRRRPSTIQ